MSFKALEWARSVKTGSPTRKAVLRAIAEYADMDGKAWPSQARLAEDTEFTVRGVRKAIMELEEMGLISREEQRRKDGTQAADIIFLNFAWVDRRNTVPPAEKQAERGSSQAEPYSQQAERHSSQAERGSAPTTFEPPSNLHQEPSNEPDSRAGPWPQDFWERFQGAYPNLVRLRATLNLLRQIQAEGETRFDDILEGIARYVAAKPNDRNWLGSDTFLADRRYEDRPAPLVAPGRQPPLTGQAARLAQLASNFQGGSDGASGSQPSQRRAYGTRGSYGSGQPVPWTSGDDARPSAEVLLIADRRAYGGRA
ncbi:helix-turn-helix domain-containing protein [Methylobacterium nonmethylotrophicum]|nr:helix-turn-helix domain-containing protein [Methylobacterium nonmethylotrophicum]